MTKHCPGDEATTLELIQQQGEDSSWLRHRGLAAELDRRLLQGATEIELSEVRASWRGHIAHLRRTHNLATALEPNGIWRIVGVVPAHAQALADAPLLVDADEDPDAEYEDLPECAEAHNHQALDRIAISAKALAALATANLLDSILVKGSVGMLIRQASESNHWHNCAHYRSTDARRLIEAAAPATAGAYQAFCTRNLRHEHVVPNSVIYRMLCAEADKSATNIEALLKRFCIRATITRQEDSRLGQAGLASAMPHEFYEAGHPLRLDPMARYKFIGLFATLEARATARWFMD